MKKVIVGFGAALVALVLNAGTAEVTFTSPIDLATHPWVDAATDSPVRFNANSQTGAFTLGRDLDLDGYEFLMNSATLFDFTEGSHTLGKISSFKENGSKYIKLLGGTWNFKASAWFRCAYTGSTVVDGSAIIFDGTTVDMSASGTYLQGFYGANNSLILTNNAYFRTTTIQYLCKGDGKDTRTNNLIHISGGSKLIAVSPAFDYSYTSTGLTGNRLTVTGEGSYIGLPATGYGTFSIGGSSSGNEALFTDGAYGYFGNVAVGNGANGKHNTLIVENGAAVRTQQSLYLGKVVGADYNKAIVRDGGSYTNGSTDVVHVGYAGCFNELEIDNGSIPSCYWITCGTNPGADHNVVRVKGDGYFIQSNSYEYLFGLGQYNKWVFDGTTNMPIRTTQKNLMLWFLDDVNAGKTSNGTTNNTFEVVNGSVLNLYDLTVGRYCASNTVRFADSTVSVPHDLKIHGYCNDLVLSNATFKLSISGDNLSMGGPYFDPAKGESQAYRGDGNRLILQGQSRICRYDAAEYSSGKLYCNSTLRFEVPAEGYAEPIFQGVGLNLYYPFKIEVAGIEALQKNLKKSTKYQLTAVNSESGANNGNITFYDLPEGKTRQDILDEVNATLPKGCYLYTYNTNGLGLRVKANVGMMLIVR